MTIAFKTIIAPALLAVFLGLAATSPVARAFADQTDHWTYDLNKEDAELGDYSGWNSGADRKDARPGYDFGRTFGFGRSAGTDKGDARTPADAGPSAPARPADAPVPGTGK